MFGTVPLKCYLSVALWRYCTSTLFPQSLYRVRVRDSHESAASRHGPRDCQWDFRTRVCACALMTYDSMRLKPRCLPGVDNGDMLKQSVCLQCIITLVSCSIVSGAVNYFWGYVRALVLFTAVDFLVAYEEKALLILYDWKIPRFRSNILFLMRFCCWVVNKNSII